MCYVIPVALHLKVYYSPGGYTPRRGADTDGIHAPLLQVCAALGLEPEQRSNILHSNILLLLQVMLPLTYLKLCSS